MVDGYIVHRTWIMSSCNRTEIRKCAQEFRRYLTAGLSCTRLGPGPNAELVNRMLVNAVESLPAETKLLIHSDCWCHYR